MPHARPASIHLLLTRWDTNPSLPASLPLQDSGIAGSVHATEAAWAGILHPSNRLDGPEGPTDFPPEEGPFRFTPNRFTRKQ